MLADANPACVLTDSGAPGVLLAAGTKGKRAALPNAQVMLHQPLIGGVMQGPATDLGIGSGHASIGDQDKARAILSVPGDHYCAYLLALGYPADRPLAPLRHLDRRPFDQVVHRGHW